MLDYKSILVKRFALGMSGRDIAKELGCSKSGINKFLVAFSKCDTLGYPLPREITNYAIHQEVYGAPPSQKGQRHEDYEKGRDLSWPLNSAAWPLRNALVATPARRMHFSFPQFVSSIQNCILPRRAVVEELPNSRSAVQNSRLI